MNINYLQAKELIECSTNKLIEIINTIDLQEKNLKVGSGNILFFNGGEIINGSLEGQGNIMLGNIKISAQIAGSWHTFISDSDLQIKGKISYDKKTEKVGVYNGTTTNDCLGNPINATTIGRTIERPTGIKLGFIYKNTETGKWEIFNGTSWENLDGTEVASADDVETANEEGS